jgi:hypothetical protein
MQRTIRQLVSSLLRHEDPRMFADAPSRPQSPMSRESTGLLLTLCWREVDSNLQYRAVKGKVWPERKRFQPVTVEMWGPENRCSQVRETVISFPSHSALLWLRRAMSRWRSGPQGWASANPTLEFPSRATSQRYAQVIAIMHTHLGAGRHGSAFLLLRLDPLHRARLGHGLKKPRRGVLLFLSSSCFPLRTDWVRALDSVGLQQVRY